MVFNGVNPLLSYITDHKSIIYFTLFTHTSAYTDTALHLPLTCTLGHLNATAFLSKLRNLPASLSHLLTQ